MSEFLICDGESDALLRIGDQLESKSKAYALRVGGDGNFVVYDVMNGEVPVWQSGSAYQDVGRYFLALQPDGNLVIYYGDPDQGVKISIWSSDTNAPEHTDCYLHLEDSGIVSLFTGDPTCPIDKIWTSAVGTPETMEL